MRPPNHRAQLATQMARDELLPTGDTQVDALVLLLTGQPCPLESVVYAMDLWREPDHRAALDAFLLSGLSLQAISTVLEIPLDVLGAYGHLFMDVGAFRNKLEKRSFAAHYDGDKFAIEMVRTAVVAGPEYLLWTYDGNHELLETRQVVRRAMVDAYHRSVAHRGNALNTEITKEAHKWMQFSVTNAALLEKIDPRASKAAHEELRIAIEGEDTTMPLEGATIPLDSVIH